MPRGRGRVPRLGGRRAPGARAADRRHPEQDRTQHPAHHSNPSHQPPPACKAPMVADVPRPAPCPRHTRSAPATGGGMMTRPVGPRGRTVWRHGGGGRVGDTRVRRRAGGGFPVWLEKRGATSPASGRACGLGARGVRSGRRPGPGRRDVPAPGRRRSRAVRRPVRRHRPRRPRLRPRRRRGQHLPGRLGTARRGAVEPRHRDVPARRLLLRRQPHPRLQPRAHLRSGLRRLRQRPLHAHAGDRTAGVRHVLPRQRAGGARQLPRHLRQRHRHRPHRHPALGHRPLHLPGVRHPPGRREHRRGQGVHRGHRIGRHRHRHALRVQRQRRLLQVQEPLPALLPRHLRPALRPGRPPRRQGGHGHGHLRPPGCAR